MHFASSGIDHCHVGFELGGFKRAPVMGERGNQFDNIVSIHLGL